MRNWIYRNWIYQNIFIVFKVYILVLPLFACYRFILFFSEIGRLDDTVSAWEIMYSFIMGLRFDIVVSSYILFLPYIILSIQFLLGYSKKAVNTIIFYYVLVLFSFSFLVSAADIPYFKQFFSRFSITAFKWFDTPLIVFKMIVETPVYWMYLIPFLLSVIVFYKFLKAIFQENIISHKSSGLILKIIVTLFFAGIVFLGIRGRIHGMSPIRVGTAYFCNNPFLNQLGLNPNFTLIRSYLDSRKEENIPIALMDDRVAIANVQEYLNITNPDPDFPLLRKENVDSIVNIKHNVVVVLMESMLASNMKRNGNPYNLTPFLDSIANNGYYFENEYTAGNHSFTGIFGTLFSFPILFEQHPMRGVPMVKYHGIATTLKGLDYSTIYFTTHDGQFDNNEGFLRFNDYDKFVSESDYPSKEVKTIFGVPDDYMFEFSMPILNDLHNLNKPFLSVFLTTSNHGPYYVPPYFEPKNKETKSRSIEYADYSLKKFIELSSKQKWFDNTIFVFVADHGLPINAIYDISLDCYHSPLIFYAPKIIQEKKVFSKIAGSIDIFPSIMGLLKLPYNNNTLGVNLFKDERPYIFINADDKFGVLDNDWFLIIRKDKFVGLYKYRLRDTKNYEGEYPEIVTKMKTFAESNLQAYQSVLNSKKQ